MRKSVGVRRGRYNIAAAEKNGIIFKIKKIKQNNNKKNSHRAWNYGNKQFFKRRRTTFTMMAHYPEDI